jgi:SAM-dependent methyltransferase
MRTSPVTGSLNPSKPAQEKWDMGRASAGISLSTLISDLQCVTDEFPPESVQRGINRNWNNYRFLLAQITELLGDRAASINLLDLGAGAAVIPLVLAKAGVSVTVLDTWAQYAPEYNNLMGTFAQFVAQFQKYGVRWVEHDLFNPPLPLQDSSFDVITMFDVMEHLPRPRPVVQEALRLLRPNGLFIIKLPNTANLRNRIRMLAGRSPHADGIESWFSEPFYGHYREMTMSEVKESLRLSGMEIVSAKYTEACHWNTRLDEGRWSRRLRVRSPRELAQLAYLAATYLVPSCRYEIFVAARKKSGAPRRATGARG